MPVGIFSDQCDSSATSGKVNEKSCRQNKHKLEEKIANIKMCLIAAVADDNTIVQV